jgi:hypothetical protein
VSESDGIIGGGAIIGPIGEQFMG